MVSILQINNRLLDAKLVIFDIFGKEIGKEIITDDKIDMAKFNLVNEVYFVRISNDDKLVVLKIVVD